MSIKSTNNFLNARISQTNTKKESIKPMLDCLLEIKADQIPALNPKDKQGKQTPAFGKGGWGK